jgi:hypothetical protein
MLAKRWHVLAAFGGGCLSTVLIVAVWRADGEAPERPDGRERREPLHDVVVSTTPEPSVTTADIPNVATPTSDAPVAGEPAPESGQPLADVLAKLEAEYRERLVVASARQPPSNEAPPPAAAAPAPLAIEPAPAPPPAVALAPRTSPAAAPPAVATPAPAASAAPAEPSSVLAAVARPEREERREDADRAARDLYIANLYQMEAYQRQQLAILGYLELLSQSSTGNLASPPRGVARPDTRRSPSFSFPLTNPNNPWGFTHPPTVLAK